MKILILTHGIRGDVQPYAALALALQQPGYHAVPAAPAASAGFAQRCRGVAQRVDGGEPVGCERARWSEPAEVRARLRKAPPRHPVQSPATCDAAVYRR
ncbi:hypothetical protein GCM10018952_61080 [Streptosporangium vulgare]